MPRFQGLSLSLLLLASPAFAASPTAQKLQSFKDAKSALAGKIDAFLQDVDACNPPVAMIKNKIMQGFGGTQPDSAKSLLALHEKNVLDHSTLADGKFSDIEKANASCTDRDQLLKRTSDAGAEVQSNLAEDMSDYKKGIDEANKQKSIVITALNLRQSGIDKHLPMPAGDVARCEAAKAKVKDMEDANAALMASLTDLQVGYTQKVTFLAAAVSAPAACQRASGLFQKASFQPDAPSGDEPEREHVEGEGATAI